MTSVPSCRPPGENPDVAALVEHEHIETASHLIVRLVKSVYAFASEYVDLVAADIAPLAVPTAPAHFLGVVHLRGRIVPVVDLPAILGLARPEGREMPDEDTRRLVTLSVEGRPFAVVADEVLGLRDVPVDDIAVEPETECERNTGSVVAARFDDESGVAAVLDLPALVSLLVGNQPGKSG